MSDDSASDFTPINTPSEGSIYTPSGSISDLSRSSPSLIDHPAETPSRVSALSSRSSSVSSHGSESSWDDSDAEAEWRESIHQLELLLSMIVIPFFGKWVGRKCAYWGMFSEALEAVYGDTEAESYWNIAWAKFMTWKHPGLDVVITSKATYNIAGAVGALSAPSAPL